MTPKEPQPDMVSQSQKRAPLAQGAAHPRTQIDIFTDSSFTSTIEEDPSRIDLENNDNDNNNKNNNNNSAPLRDILVSNAQNRQSKPNPVESLTVELKKLHIGEPHEINQVAKRKFDFNLKPISQSGSRLTRPHLAANTFEELETVFEDDNRDPSTPAALRVSDSSQRYIELPANQYSTHPLATAVRDLLSVDKQLEKHRDGVFEWVLTVKLPAHPPSDKQSPASAVANSRAVRKVFFGCNLFPVTTKSEFELDGNFKDASQDIYTLLVTPLEGNAELEAMSEVVDDKDMAIAETTGEYATPMKNLESQTAVTVLELTPVSPTSIGPDDNFVRTAASRRTPTKHVERIEDSFEALDKLEEQMEAFNVAAHLRSSISPNLDKPVTKSPQQMSAARSPEPARSTPQPKRPSTRTGVSTLRTTTKGPARSSSIRKSTSMIFLDSPKLKEEDKALMQAPPKKTPSKGLASLLPPKQLAKSSKPPTIPTFELPGEAVARRLKEQREARLSMAAAPEPGTPPTISGIRRIKSTKPPTRINFELPGEAISRRKREEHEARLRAQEEEERKRREFKAKPIRSGTVPSSVPRDTITSRARQNKPSLENSAQPATSVFGKRASLALAREPLSSTNNQSSARGRHLTTESSVTSEMSRATSSSTGSLSGKRSSISLEEVQQQRLRGKEVLHRDSLFAQDREREKRERETLARFAREQAAERSRLQSREWAERQKRKRATVSSLRDVAASS